MTIKEQTDDLKVAEKTIYRCASEGKIPGFKVGRARRFWEGGIDRWISEQKQKSKDKNDGN